MQNSRYYMAPILTLCGFSVTERERERRGEYLLCFACYLFSSIYLLLDWWAVQIKTRHQFTTKEGLLQVLKLYLSYLPKFGQKSNLSSQSLTTWSIPGESMQTELTTKQASKRCMHVSVLLSQTSCEAMKHCCLEDINSPSEVGGPA